MITDEAKEDLRYIVKDKLVEMGHETYMERDAALHDISVVVDIIQAKRTLDVFGRLKKRK